MQDWKELELRLEYSKKLLAQMEVNNIFWINFITSTIENYNSNVKEKVDKALDWTEASWQER